jgi:ADP-heptose:LPS heptosyltransferase
MTRAQDFSEQPRILILKLDHIGDFVLAMRPLKELREAWPKASITLVCGPWNVGLAKRAGLFDRIVPYAFFPESFGEFQKVSAYNYGDFAKIDLGDPFDIALDMRYYDETRPLLSIVDTKFRVGYTAGNLAVPLDIELPAAETFSRKWAAKHEPLHDELRMMLLAAAVVSVFRAAKPHPLQHVMDAAPHDGLVDNQYIVVAPGAGTSAKMWPIESFVGLCVRLAKATNYDFVITGHNRDHESARMITTALPLGRARELLGGPVEQLPILLGKAALCIGNNSAPAHIAAQLGMPTICIFSGTNDYRIWQPIGPKVRTMHTPIGCSPCYLNRREDCPIAVRCLSSITVDQVTEIALDMLVARHS